MHKFVFLKVIKGFHQLDAWVFCYSKRQIKNTIYFINFFPGQLKYYCDNKLWNFKNYCIVNVWTFSFVCFPILWHFYDKIKWFYVQIVLILSEISCWFIELKINLKKLHANIDVRLKCNFRKGLMFIALGWCASRYLSSWM